MSKTIKTAVASLSVSQNPNLEVTGRLALIFFYPAFKEKRKSEKDKRGGNALPRGVRNHMKTCYFRIQPKTTSTMRHSHL